MVVRREWRMGPRVPRKQTSLGLQPRPTIYTLWHRKGNYKFGGVYLDKRIAEIEAERVNRAWSGSVIYASWYREEL